MAISIDWPSGVISIPKAYLTLVQSTPTEIRALDINQFRLDLKGLEYTEAGMPWLRTHNNNAPVTVGGVTLARVIEIINGYTVTFEDGQYAVNLAGANSNIGDVTNVNQVSVRSANSAGLTYSKEMEDLAYTNASVWIDTENGASGTNYPMGTPSHPVDTLAAAQVIIGARSLPFRLHLHGTITVAATDSIDEYQVIGDSPMMASIVFVNGCGTDHVHLHGLGVSGDLEGMTDLEDCLVGSTTGFHGRMLSCGIAGPVVLRAHPSKL